jgi:iodotyrosine deiodinase
MMSERNGHTFIPLEFEHLSTEEQVSRAHEFELRMRTRRTVRQFSPRQVPRELIETALRIASRAPSGANQQPWRFVVILDPEIKRKIRIAAEAEERDNYERRFPHEWLDALAPLGTDWHKDFLDIAPCLIAVFRLDYGIVPDREGNLQKIKHYYVQESVGIACGFLIAALHWMGLATLTHTPSPMGFLSQVLKRPATRNRTFSFPSDFPRTTLRSRHRQEISQRDRRFSGMTRPTPLS